MRILHIRFSGCQRLGIVLSGLWLILVPTAYFIGIATYQSPVTSVFRKFYIWVPGDPKIASGQIGFIPDIPITDGWALALLCILPILAGWLALFVLPRSIRWIRDGFHHDKPNAA